MVCFIPRFNNIIIIIIIHSRCKSDKPLDSWLAAVIDQSMDSDSFLLQKTFSRLLTVKRLYLPSKARHPKLLQPTYTMPSKLCHVVMISDCVLCCCCCCCCVFCCCAHCCCVFCHFLLGVLPQQPDLPTLIPLLLVK